MGTCTGGVRFLNSNRIIPSDYRILLLLKMAIPSLYMLSIIVLRNSESSKIGIGRSHFQEIGIGQENCNRCISTDYRTDFPDKMRI